MCWIAIANTISFLCAVKSNLNTILVRHLHEQCTLLKPNTSPITEMPSRVGFHLPPCHLYNTSMSDISIENIGNTKSEAQDVVRRQGSKLNNIYALKAVFRIFCELSK